MSVSTSCCPPCTYRYYIYTWICIYVASLSPFGGDRACVVPHTRLCELTYVLANKDSARARPPRAVLINRCSLRSRVVALRESAFNETTVGFYIHRAAAAAAAPCYYRPSAIATPAMPQITEKNLGKNIPLADGIPTFVFHRLAAFRPATALIN